MRSLRPLSGRRYNALLRLIQGYDMEGRKCLTARAYHAASVFKAAALEGMMLAMCSVYVEELERGGHLPKTFGRLEKWDMGLLINVTTRAGWIPKRRTERGPKKVGDWVDTVRRLRNTVHPGNYLENRAHIRITKRDYGILDEVVSAAFAHLTGKLEGDLAKQMGIDPGRTEKKGHPASIAARPKKIGAVRRGR